MSKIVYQDTRTGKIKGSAIFKKLRSGKSVDTYFDKNGIIQNEMHHYGIIDIGLQYDFKKGKKSSELYFFKNRLVSRKKYEKERAHFKDMPPADMIFEDISGDIVRSANRERREKINKRIL